MSPDSPKPSTTRRAWRALSALGCVLGAASILLTAVKWTGTDDQVDAIARLSLENASLIRKTDAQTRKINEQRRESLIISCRRDRAKNRAIVGYLADLGARPAALARAEKFFPLHQDCVAQARARTRTTP